MTDPGDGRARIAAQQAALVAALVAGGEPPPGVDAHRVAVTAAALLRKRTGEVARRWPALLATPAARARFVAWARDRPPAGSLADGWDFAEHLEATGDLTGPAAAALTAVRRRWTRDDDGHPRRRRLWASPRARGRRGR